MTELLKPDHLRQIARVLDQLAETCQRPVPVLQWSANAESGRPVSRWVVSEGRNAAS